MSVENLDVDKIAIDAVQIGVDASLNGNFILLGAFQTMIDDEFSWEFINCDIISVISPID